MSYDEQFTRGKQPCKAFTPSQEWWGSNRHQCVYCGGDVVVSFCEGCNKDHHQNGYETCKVIDSVWL
jgi:hypothetical protein